MQDDSTIQQQVLYAREQNLDVREFRDVLIDSGLGRIRPVGDEARLRQLISGAGLIVTARLASRNRTLVGVARCVTDFSWCCYLSDLAVAKSAQGLGVGKGLLDEVRRQLGPQVSVTLVSVPDAIGFYQKVGMARLADAFSFMRAA
jgi:ribosomal protein S18 acetylase RimI-like enzyme